MKHAYLGPEFSNEEIKENLDRHKLSYNHHDDITGVAAELLAKGNVIAWFQGKMEFGPRALGNRSILSTPAGDGTKDKVNMVKNRELWRPFGPSILANYAKEWFVNGEESPFMTLCFEVKEDKKELVPSVVHTDGTTRPQTVSKDTNKMYYDLLDNFRKLTDIPMLLNTSFNEKVEPIVCSPEDAIRNFNKMDLDYLAIGNYLIKK
jgi:carbamoyltransferase